MKFHPNNLSQDFKKYLITQKLSEATTRYYISDVRVFLRFIYQISGDYEITSEMFESYENYLKSGSLPTKTVNRKLSSLRIFNSYLIEGGFLKVNVMQKIKNDNNRFSNKNIRFGSTTMILLLFLMIILFGSFILYSSNQNIFFNEKNSLFPKQIGVLTESKKDFEELPYVLNSQSLEDISVEGNIVNETPKSIYLGKDYIDPGKTSSVITKSLSTNAGLIFITPTSFLEGSFFVKQVSGNYVIYLSKAQTESFTFNWMIVSNQLPVDKLQQ